MLCSAIPKLTFIKLQVGRILLCRQTSEAGVRLRISQLAVLRTSASLPPLIKDRSRRPHLQTGDFVCPSFILPTLPLDCALAGQRVRLRIPVYACSKYPRKFPIFCHFFPLTSRLSGRQARSASRSVVMIS